MKQRERRLRDFLTIQIPATTSSVQGGDRGLIVPLSTQEADARDLFPSSEMFPMSIPSTPTLFATAALCCIPADLAANADVVLNFTELSVSGGADATLFSNPSAALVGTVTGVSVDADLVAASSASMSAQRAFLYFGAPIAGFVASVGSVANPFPFPTWQNPQWYSWPNAGAADQSTRLLGRIDFYQPFSASSTSRIGLSLPFATNSEWLRLSGTITFHGVEAVPAPGAILVFGLAGMSSGRRRRR